MLIDLFYSGLLRAIPEAISIFPRVFLQAIALIGLFSTFLIFYDFQKLSRKNDYILGIFFGVSCLILLLLMTGGLKVPIETLILTDFIFLAGFLGGWRNAIIVGCFAFGGRLLLGGITHWSFPFFNIFSIVLSSSLLHYYYQKYNKDYLNIKSGAILVLWRFFIIEFPLVIIFFISPNERDLIINLMARRFIGSFSFSVLILFAVIFLLQREKERGRQLYFDVLSGLPNRRALQKDIEENYRQDQQIHRSLLLIDICNLRDLVQELGYKWADMFINNMSQKLLQLTKEDWLAIYKTQVYCFSDRSFVLILQNIRIEKVEEKGIALQIYNILSTNEHSHNKMIKPCLSIGGFEVAPENIKNPMRFLRTLAFAERFSDGSIRYFESNVMHQIHKEKKIRYYIEQWIEEKRMPLWLQPKVSLTDSSCVGAESLLRAWQPNNTSRYFSPPEIFKIAETHRMLHELEWTSVETIVSYLESMPSELHHIPLSLNLSPSTFSNANFGQRICNLLSEKQIDSNRLVVEVIETSKLSFSDNIVQENFNCLIKNGIKLSLDDFGTGYASISLLSQLPFSELKLDYSLVSNIYEERSYSAIVMSVQGAKLYNATIVAEGIETIEQQQMLAELGVEKGQGFLFAKAISLEDFILYAKDKK
ncbi:EAL domain-containing protein [Desulfovibrio litoralis]|uniref:EAL domain, c-di-GMP-specific phosphodiesterase class I (Or its enzymatically inactive variant) n=1 Tax=Desulfovibrio litoralis DSM 11393 TaxID=1121455 RepID=A0A1M7SPY6_9BACT|nr:EAL domain-containing protein [Desulfovibrio litoralis]SHN60458.1 EAL domain, c-di-GMP-specific phosphodiesterase class I (or its enzymatically inactive variant) [Desulfovibrio litoralis DSM 11393]